MFQKLTLAALALLVSGVATAADKGLNRDLDINEDGAISPEEAAALPSLNDNWVVLDVNADGMLDQAEFAKLEFIEADSKSKSK